MMAWLRLHGMAFAAAVSKLARTPFASLLNILVIGVALALPAGAYTLLVNLQGAARGVSSDPELSVFQGVVSDSGEGRWSLEAAIDLGVPAPVLASALFSRFSSRGEETLSNKILSAMRNEFGGHVEAPAP